MESRFFGWKRAELRSLLDGPVRLPTAEELAGRQGLRMVAPDNCHSQAEYITYFDDAIAVMQTEAALERIALELCEDSAAENVDYLEVRWAPRLHLRGGLPMERVIQAVLTGLEAGPIQAMAIVCAMRQHSPDENVELAQVAGRFAGKVVGFDLAGDEVLYPAAPHAAAFAAARAARLHPDCHAGAAGLPPHTPGVLQRCVARHRLGLHRAPR